jgi:hypothetical protein
MSAQLAWSGISSARKVANGYQNALDMCEQNRRLSLQNDILGQCIQTGAATQVAIDELHDIVDAWGQTWLDLQTRAARISAHFLTQYVLFLVFLAFVTLMLYFAIEKKAGRLDRLFGKINALSDAAAPSLHSDLV